MFRIPHSCSDRSSCTHSKARSMAINKSRVRTGIDKKEKLERQRDRMKHRERREGERKIERRGQHSSPVVLAI